MMTLLAKLFGSLAGPWLSKLTLPATVLGIVVLLHQFWIQREARLQAQATNICTANWETEIRKQERDAATASATAAHSILEGERSVNERLRNEIATIKTENQTLADASVGTDTRCLSDGVLRAIGGDGRDPASNSRRPKARPGS